MGNAKLDGKGVVVVCGSCSARNRIAYSRLNEQNRCGQCKAALRMPDAPIEIQAEADFYSLTENSGLPVLVDFWAPWCGPCRTLGPELERVASANAGSFLVAKANTEALPNVASAFRVMSIPALALFHHGRLLARTEGARPAAEIHRFVTQAMASAGD